MPSNFHFVVSAVPYWFNCTECGKPLSVPGNVEATDLMRRQGVCDDCLEKRLRKVMKKVAPVLLTPMPKEVWRN